MTDAPKGEDQAQPAEDTGAATTPTPETESGTPKKKRTRKKASRKTTKKKAASDNADADDSTDAPTEPDTAESESESESESSNTTKKKPARKKSTKKAASTKKTTRKKSSAKKDDTDDDKPSSSSSGSSKGPRTEMVVNYVPGEDCRIAILEDGNLEEFFSEHTDKVSRVGNIYVGRVANVEPAIQAAFIDFGGEENGFLHITDLHPQYFSKHSDDKVERVGKKTPHRQRPPIQEALKRGQEIIVQVQKEGVGTKGPSLTSYLSIPGRFLVMMPGMDKTGVSRKEEDDEKRKAAKEILGALDLPEGFGFILRTAGFDRNKTELKRDLAYLKRLWSDMEKRRKGGKKPRLLYTESDLLLRTVRDLLSSEMDRVVIDSLPALKRVARFIKIAAPRAQAKLAHYAGTAPVFHAFGVEEQIEAIHAREVPLPSGGRLVIDQTEALVAIDVNSGKSRAARDAETNAFKTNLEAVDAICRQLRLRDLGGLVVNDMIDMRHASHRKEIENRFKERLKRDRAKTTVAPISPFGLLEMTRQRMRGSMESQHFAECPVCKGRGLVKRPGSVADSAIRELAAIVDHPKVARVELVVSPRVASELLSTRRSALVRVELMSQKKIEVRVVDTLGVGRFAIYAYEENGNDLDVEKIATQQRPKPTIVEWKDTEEGAETWAVDPTEEGDETTVLKLAEEFAKRAEAVENAELPIDDSRPLDDDDDSEGSGKKKRKRRRRGRRRGSREDSDTQHDHADDRSDDSDDSDNAPPSDIDDAPEPDDANKKKRAKRRSRRRAAKGDKSAESPAPSESAKDEPAKQSPKAAGDKPEEATEKSAPKKKSRRSRGKKPSGDSEKAPSDKPAPDATKKSEQDAPKSGSSSEVAPKPRRRGLYSGARRRISASDLPSDRD
jgi:ribonuclease E